MNSGIPFLREPADEPVVEDTATGHAESTTGSRRPPWRRRISLTTRLVMVLCASVALAMLASAVATLPLVSRVMTQQTQDELRGVVTRDDSRLWRGTNHGGPNPYYVLLTDMNGTVVSQRFPGSVDADDGQAPSVDALVAHDKSKQTPGGQRQDKEALEVWKAPAENGRTSWLVVAVPVVYNGSQVGWQYVAKSTQETNRTLLRYAAGLLALGLVILPGVALIGSWAVRRSLRPLKHVEEVTTAFGAGDTSRRVEGLWPGTEVGRVGSSVNLMLDQIDDELAARQASEMRMRRFVGDASHELRTPLAAVRGFAELYRMGAVAPDDVPSTMRRIEDESKRMGLLVEDLLMLARMDQERPMQAQPVNLLGLARDASQDAHALAPDRSVRLTGLGGAELSPGRMNVTGDEAHLRQVVTNLVANAVRHTPGGTPLEIEVGRVDAEVVLRVVDHGHGIAPEHAGKVFERFYRADASRSRGAGGGSGLGLAIVAAIVQAHSGTVSVLTTPGGGATFEVRLPATTPGAAGSHQHSPNAQTPSTLLDTSKAR